MEYYSVFKKKEEEEAVTCYSAFETGRDNARQNKPNTERNNVIGSHK